LGYTGYITLNASSPDTQLHGVSHTPLQSVPTLQQVNAKSLGVLLGSLAGATSIALASGQDLDPPYLPWSHLPYLSTFDHKSLRRGYEVYRQVCSTCHSMKYLYFRNLIGVTHNEEQVKLIAKQYEVRDGPNSEGEMFERPGKPSDAFPQPYPNEEAARFANGGALPPDLSCLVKARPRKEDYVFSILTGYREPPAGVVIRKGLYYNPYFPGGAIGMAPPLNDGQIEYEDGTIPSRSQLAKDVTTFLAWCSEPESDERKRTGSKIITALAIAALFAGYHKRFRWNPIKTARTTWIK